MTAKTMRCTLFGGALVALAGLASFPVAAADANGTAATSDDAAATSPMVVAQVSRRPAAIAPRLVVPDAAAYPAYQRGVRKAADEGSEALRRYIWRTRMIYNFYYPDFASG